MSIIDRIKIFAGRKSKRANRRNVINSDLKTSTFRRLPVFDWEDEAQLFDPTTPGTPKDDVGEFAWLEIRDNPVTPTHQTPSSSSGVWWNGLYANGCLEWWDPVKHTEQSDKVQIKDGGFAGVWADTSDWARMTAFKVDVDMAFNHDRGVNSGTDGSDNTERHAPELQMNSASWSSPNGTINNKEVLYLKDKTVTVFNRFVMSPAIPGNIPLTLEADAAGVAIGGLNAKSVTITNGISTGTKSVAGVAGFIEFTAKAKTAAAVNKETSTFDWKVTKINTKTTGIDK